VECFNFIWLAYIPWLRPLELTTTANANLRSGLVAEGKSAIPECHATTY
jgi:hypothetical protein